MKVIITGSHEITNPQILIYALKEAISERLYISELVCGMADGVDMLGLRWAQENKIPIRKFIANSDMYSPIFANRIRNREMVEYADGLIAIWDGISRETRHVISEARKFKLEIFIYKAGGTIL